MKRTKILICEQLPDIITPQQVADYVGISRQRVYEFCQCGQLKSFAIGASRKIHKVDMLQWIENFSESSSK